MDLALFARVVWRFKLLVLGGFLLAIALTFLAVVRVSPGSPHFSYRQKETWEGQATLLVTQRGFPWGGTQYSPSADPGRYGQLATIYARLATSDAVRRIVKRMGPLDEEHETFDALVVLSGAYSNAPPLPLITILAHAGTRERAELLAARETDAFLTYLREQQAANAIPKSKRVVVSVVRRPGPAKLLKGRSKTLPLVILMTIMLATFAVAYLLENLRPRVRAVDAAVDALPEPSRRSA